MGPSGSEHRSTNSKRKTLPYANFTTGSPALAIITHPNRINKSIHNHNFKSTTM
jgi:hypothetical protein